MNKINEIPEEFVSGEQEYKQFEICKNYNGDYKTRYYAYSENHHNGNSCDEIFYDMDIPISALKRMQDDLLISCKKKAKNIIIEMQGNLLLANFGIK